MSNTAKVGLFALAATAIAAIAFYGKRTVTEWGNKFNLAFQSIGKPVLKMGVLTVPVNILLNNAIPVAITLDNLRIQLVKDGTNVFADTGNSGALPINPGNNELTVTPTITLAKILSSNWASNITNVLANQSALVNFIVRVQATYLGVTVTQDYPKQFYLTDLLKPSSLGMVPTGKRNVKPVPANLKKLVPLPTGNNEVIKQYGADPLKDTVPLIQRLVKRQLYQGKKLAAALKGKTVEETVKNNWDFFNKHIQYKQDAEGKEQVRSLRRVVYGGFGDCDDYVCSLSNLLTNQGIKHKLRVTAYNNSSNPSHIYIVVPANGKNIVLDPVVHKFNYEVPYTTKHDYEA